MAKTNWIAGLKTGARKRCASCGSKYEASINEFVALKKKGVEVTWATFWRGLVQEEGYPYCVAALMSHVRNCLGVTA